MTSAPTLPSATTAWRAVLDRNTAFDGRFVYAVSSTGIYCRPSCPSRRPSRANVGFYPDAASAERAGFRPCRRCRPAARHSPTGELVGRARRIIDNRVGERITLAALARAVGASPSHVRRAFSRLLGISPAAYAAAHRTEALRRELRRAATVTEATYEAGFGSGSRVYERADGHLGMTPATYRRGGAGTVVRYAIARSELGLLLAAATSRGICRVAFGTSRKALVASLAQEFPGARLEANRRALEPLVTELLRRVEGARPGAAIPLDIRATAFQAQVWRALQRVAHGETRSYADVAASVRRPSAVRAVAAACAANPVAVAVPCHRVVRSDGRLGGYRWGARRKARLLAAERACAADAESARD